MGVLEVLTIIFAYLKLTEVDPFVTWSWWWVFSPMWIGYGIGFVIWLLMLGFMAWASGR